jgi:predicted short-subunit dehydrogenase-like oxidoreductase (DUF2520 family)
MTTLNIIGPGKVGKTLGYLLTQKANFILNTILGRSLNSSTQTQTLINAGTVISKYEELLPADVYLLSVSDDQLPQVVAKLSTQKIVQPGNIIFHCSGSLSSELLRPLQQQGALIASVHPIKSFGVPEKNIFDFEGTVCTVEGDDLACSFLNKHFTQLGAKVYRIPPENKMLYHAAFVFSCNYFVSIVDIALQLLEKSGIARESGYEMLEPLIIGSWQQIKSVGTASALTGPISRGDSTLVKKQLEELNLENVSIGNLYKALGKITVELAKKNKKLTPLEIKDLQNVLL